MPETLKERQISILDAIIREYIRTAHPVASQELMRHFKLGISPATIRNEMLELDEQGYLEQPHTSAGRIPTDKGYRFFVDNLLENTRISAKERKLLDELFSIDVEEEFIKEFSRAMAGFSQMFTAVGSLDEDFFYPTGLSNIFEQPEFRELEAIREFGHFADGMEEEMRSVAEKFDQGEDNERIFIGAENPWREAHSYATIIASWQHPKGFRGFLAMVGPKRTNYSRHRALIEWLKESYE